MAVLYIKDVSTGEFVPVKQIQGKNGEPGYTPQKGIDYFTEADKEEIAQEVLANFTNVSEVGQ